MNLIFNQGDGFYSDRGTGALALPVCKEPTSVLVADVNNNSIDDLLCRAVAKTRCRSGTIAVASTSATTRWRRICGRAISPSPISMATATPTHRACRKRQLGELLPQQTRRRFQGLTLLKKAAQCSKPYQIIFLDVDIDGKADVGIVGDQCIAGFFNQSQ